MSLHSTEKVPQMLWNREKRNYGISEQLVLKIYGMNGPNGQSVEDAVNFKNEGNPKFITLGLVSRFHTDSINKSLIFDHII